MRRASLPTGFTIVELLVVITIIVVLLALLTPAMDKAIYQAELAVCGANLHGVSGGGLTYAMANKRAYPSPPDGRGWNAHTTRLGYGSVPATDLRPLLKEYVELNLLLCPLTQQIALDEESNRPDAQINSPYDVWFGWQFNIDANPQRGMFRMGDRFEWNTTRFNVLATDFNFVDVVDPSAQSSHPDDAGVLSNEVYQSDEVGPTAGLGLGVPGGTYLTMSRWTRVWMQRGLIDMNVTTDDGSVERYLKVEPVDDRMSQVPSNNSQYILGVYIPSAD